jgi:Lon protease-like protein
MITLTGICRFATGEELGTNTPYRQVRADFGPFAPDLEPEHSLAFDRPRFLGLLRRYLDRKGLAVEWDAAKQAPAIALVNSLAMGLPLDRAEKQALLEAPAMADRLRVLSALLQIDAVENDDGPPPLQ